MRERLEAEGVKLLFVTCGNMRFVKAWQDNTKFPPTSVYLDQQGLLYRRFATHNGIIRTLFRPDMWIVGGLKRLLNGSWRKMLAKAVSGYKLSVPQENWQSFQQGGTFIFKGRHQIFTHKDRTPGDYPDWDKVVQKAAEAKRSLQAK